MTKNYTPHVRRELKRAGYIFLRDGKHGEIWTHPKRPPITVAVVIRTRKIANNTLMRAKL